MQFTIETRRKQKSFIHFKIGKRQQQNEMNVSSLIIICTSMHDDCSIVVLRHSIFTFPFPLKKKKRRNKVLNAAVNNNNNTMERKRRDGGEIIRLLIK